MKNSKTPFHISITDCQIVIASGICLLMRNIIPEFQVMTACIATLFCVQEGMKPSFKAGLARLMVTAIGGLAGLLVILLDKMADSPQFFIILTMAGLLLTLFICKLTRVPPFTTRIGGVTFILVVVVKTGTNTIYYAVFRLLSTLYGVIAVIVTMTVFALFGKIKQHLLRRRD
jgi:uncharacterized membrane protein YgaE (UPF0421/DUF939 family)